MGITQGASGFCFFATSLYSYLCGADIADIEVPDSEVPNLEVKFLLDQVCHVANILCSGSS